jgi:membrane protein implicated in regulation of membrane protease activity
LNITDVNMAGAGEKPESYSWNGKVLLRYTLFQIPGLIALILLLIVVRHWIDLPLWPVYIIIAVWVIKDIILFPFVWKAYDIRSKDANLRMIGDKGVAQEFLNPSGYILINGELWKAEVAKGSPPIPKGTLLRVKEIHGLNLIVEEEIN